MGFSSPDLKELYLTGTIHLRRSELGLQFDTPMDGLIGVIQAVT